MSNASIERWPGCHGVRLRSSALDVGATSGHPLADVTLRVATLPDPIPDELWRIHGEAITGRVKREVDRWLCRHPGGQLVVHASAGPAVAFDPSTGEIVTSPGSESLVLQLVTSFGLPLVLNGEPALVVHASACVNDGEAVVFCGPSGSGKSSALVRLLDAGWRGLTEDVCCFDMRRRQPLAWPGPPWVRRVPGDEGPHGAVVRFESPDKLAWDIAPWQHDAPAPVSFMVFLDPPGGDEPEWRPLSRAETVKQVAAQAVWVRDPSEAGRRLFGLAVDFAGQVRALRLRIPRGPSWLERFPEILAAAM